MKILSSVLFLQPAKLEHHWGIRAMIRARVTWGQGLPSNLEARPVLVVPVHRHPLIPGRWQRACGTSPGWWAQGCQGHHVTQSIPQGGGSPWEQGTCTFSPLAPEDPLAPCEDTKPPGRPVAGAQIPAPTSIHCPQYPPITPVCLLLTSSPGSPGSPSLPGSPWHGKTSKKQMCGIMNWGAAAAGSPHCGQAARELGPHSPSPLTPRAALTFSPLGPGKPRSPLEPCQGQQRQGRGQPQGWLAPQKARVVGGDKVNGGKASEGR